jgi:signal transduction histidine kinase
MRAFPREAANYGILLVVLFAIASIAVWHTIAFLADRISGPEHTVVAFLICIITLGFMLIAGAFGLWAIRFSAIAESRRRVGRIVDAMDYLQDGLLAVDDKCLIRGANPAARALAGGAPLAQTVLDEAFPCLSGQDLEHLLREEDPYEIERPLTNGEESRMVRFRSQPSEGMTLILLSDVTVMEAHRLRSRQIARLQLIGQIARGMAFDINNLLCAISGHASLLPRLPPESPEISESLDAIAKSVEKGTALVGHLLELVKPTRSASFTNVARAHVEAAAVALKDNLSARWRIDADIQDLPPTGMTGLQTEQVVLNLGTLAADALDEPGTLYIRAGRRSDDRLFGVDPSFAGVILIGPVDPETAAATVRDMGGEAFSEAGVILSVIRSMVEEAGGAVHFLSTPDGLPIYRVALPYGSILAGMQKSVDLPADLGPYIAEWSVLLARPAANEDELGDILTRLGVNVTSVDSIVSVLAQVEDREKIDAVIIDGQLIADEARGLLRAAVKLCPAAGIVVMCEDPQTEGAELSSEVVFIDSGAGPDQVVLAMIEARSLAIKRKV